MVSPSPFLFVHTLDHYKPAYSKDGSGAPQRTHSDPTATDVAAFVQPAPSKVVEEYRQLNENVTQTAYTLDGAAFAAIDKGDRIVFDGANYRVAGKKNPCNLDRVFRVDLSVEIR